MRIRLARYALEFLVFFALFVAIFLAYHMRSAPTKFIYYNF